MPISLIGIFLLGNSLLQKSLPQFLAGITILLAGITLQIYLKSEKKLIPAFRDFLEEIKSAY